MGISQSQKHTRTNFRASKVVVSVVGFSVWSHQVELAKAAYAAGAKVFLPSEYGTDVDQFPENPIVKTKIDIRREIEKIGIGYIFLVTGPFYEFLFGWTGWGNDLLNHKIALLGDRNTKLTASSISDAVHLVPAVINDPSKLNKVVSFGYTITTGEIHDEAQKILGGKVTEDVHLTEEVLKHKIETAPNPGAAIPSILLQMLISGKAQEPDSVDGSKYGRKLLTIHEFLPGFYEELKKKGGFLYA